MPIKGLLQHVKSHLFSLAINVLLISVLFSTSANAIEQNTEYLDDIVQAASKAGVQVIVINPNSSVNLTPPAQPEPVPAVHKSGARKHSDLANWRAKSDKFKNEAPSLYATAAASKRRNDLYFAN